MIPKLEDIITDYEGNGRFLNNTRPKLDSTISFFSMNSDLKELGPDIRYYFKDKVKID